MIPARLALSFMLEPDTAVVMARMVEGVTRGYASGRISARDYERLSADFDAGRFHRWIRTDVYWQGDVCHLFIEPTEAFARIVWGEAPRPQALTAGDSAP